MNKFYAEVEFQREGKEAGELIKAFFQEFNQESMIEVKGNKAKMEIHFETPPMKVIDSITKCENFELYYGVKKESELSDENGNENNLTKQQEGKRKYAKQKKTQITEEEVKASEVEQLAQKSKTFEEFARLIANWMEMGEKTEFFIQLLIASTEVEEITWRELEKNLAEKNITCQKYDKILISTKVGQKLQGITTLPFLKWIKKYKDYPFKDKTLVLSLENIPEIKKALSGIEKTCPLKTKVYKVLEAMGLGVELDETKEKITYLVLKAIQKEDLNEDNCIVTNGTDAMKAMDSMILSTFVNQFMKKYQKDQKVKNVDFLIAMKKLLTE